MKRANGLTAILLLIWIGALTCATAQKLTVSKEKYGFFLEGNRRFARIPFELHSNLILVPVQINGSDTLRFILDTGVSSTIVTDPKALDTNTLRLTRKVSLAGAGEGTDISAHVAIDNSLSMLHMKANHHNLIVLDKDVLHLAEYVGVPVHGIFGHEIFNNFIVTIDFSAKELILRKPGTYRYHSRKGDQYPITIEDTKPFTSAVALLADGREHPIRVVIDTGAGHALLLDKSSDERIQLPEKLIHTQVGRGLNGVINGSLGRIERVRFGRFELDNVLASFPDSNAFGAKLPDRGNRQGNIGCELLRRFKVTMNYQEGYMVLKPIKKRIKESFEHDMSGLGLRALGTDLRSYMVQHITEGSPAAYAGLQEGDQLLFVNDRPVHDMNITEIYKLMQKGDGEEIELLVKRDGKMFFTKLVLRRLI
ncbi:aspartyl protease family protein [Telluribacter humicola]|uniref:aspartyl protease family protein n=1 Tax=Telluribacter humicola TaxID=1720261 RepID=UPI001A97542B|nr:aspartyl protease family protein [Telluribacter humicola]